MVARLLKELGYSLQANRKRLEGAQHPDRNAQFEHINETIRRQLAARRAGHLGGHEEEGTGGQLQERGPRAARPGRSRGGRTCTTSSARTGKVAPYGVYDLQPERGWVSVGISHDTAEFAVRDHPHAGGRRWARPRIPHATLARHHGRRRRQQRLSAAAVEARAAGASSTNSGFPITVCHLPPGTSKWNKIEHRLFSFITQNWRGKPLVTHQVIVNLIAATTTDDRPRRAQPTRRPPLREGPPRLGRSSSRACNLEPHAFHGEWNYTIHPTGTA